eukprot:GSChrysophyteH1.ASY1.ANO1.2561.1 assembled CDS
MRVLGILIFLLSLEISVLSALPLPESVIKSIIHDLHLSSLSNIHSASLGNFAGLKSRLNGSWEDNYKLVHSSGHKWCSLQRDNWSCMGERYAKVLKNLSPYNTSLSFKHLPKGCRVFFEGNSYLMEQISAGVCNTPGVEKMFIYREKYSNDMLVHDPSSDSTLLVVDNDERMFRNRTAEDSIVRKFHPDVVVLGNINGNLSIPFENRITEFADTLQNQTKFILWYDKLPKDCRADFHDCIAGGGHQCLPGPLYRTTEEMFFQIGNACRVTRWK